MRGHEVEIEVIVEGENTQKTLIGRVAVPTD
jgi:hypothetical protein